jgi:general secretion pathway protein G
MQLSTIRRTEIAGPRSRRQRGFTLIEIMVVIAILGILAALIVPKIMSRPDEARRVAAKQDIGTVMQALKLYRLDNGRYPTQEQGLRALVEKPSTDPVPNNWKDGGYLERLPNDPWGNKAGGEGNDADVGSWQ